MEAQYIGSIQNRFLVVIAYQTFNLLYDSGALCYIERCPNINSLEFISDIIRIPESHVAIYKEFKFCSGQALTVQFKFARSLIA